MSDASIIKEFLVGLGFKVDPASFKKFEAGVASATKTVEKMSLVVAAAAVTVDVMVVKIADSLDKLYWASQRTGAAAQNILAYDYAIGQLGGTAAGARSALEGVAYFLRANPGAGGWLGALGVQTKNANGSLRDTEQVMEDLGKRFAAMPQYRAIRYAQMMGIDYNTMLAMERGAGGYTKEYKDFAKNIGMDLAGGTKSANAFMTSVRTLRMEFGLLAIKVGSDLITRWGPSLQKFMIWLGQHAKEVADRIATWTVRIARLGEMLFSFAMKALGFLERLDKATNGWSTGIIAVLAALQISGGGGLIMALAALNPELAAVVALVAALVAGLAFLYNDFQSFKAGKGSAIDWSPWAKDIDHMLDSIGKMSEALGRLGTTLKNVFGPIIGGYLGSLFDIFIKWIDSMATAVMHMANAMDAAMHGDWKRAAKEAALAAITSPFGQVLIGGTNAAKQAAFDASDGMLNDNARQMGISRAEMAMNPGNLRDSRFGTFRRFSSPEAGAAAMAAQILRDYRRGQTTVRSLINDPRYGWSNQWAAGNSAASTGNYISSVSRALGVGPDQQLNMTDPATLSALMMAMAKVEAGHKTYGADVFGRAAHSALGGDHVAQRYLGAHGATHVEMHQATTIHISPTHSGVSDLIRGLHDQQSRVNGDMLRNLKGAVR